MKNEGAKERERERVGERKKEEVSGPPGLALRS